MKEIIFKIFLILIIAAHFFSCGKADKQGQSIKYTDSVIHLENSVAYLSIDLYGGAFINFYLKNNPVNPLNWKLASSDMPENNQNGAPFQGHFLCLGRWGSPSEGEIAAGIPHNGQPSNSLWEIDAADSLYVTMSNYASMDGLQVNRRVEFDNKSGLFKVVEEITNKLSIGRIYNIVQHPTLAPPFLDTATLIDTNADQGFLQVYAYPDPHVREFRWPLINIDSLNEKVDLRRSDTRSDYVATHIFDNNDSWGWITASSPHKKLLIGYLWKTDEYPWLNVWHYTAGNQPVAKGLEFGTTGIGRPYEELLSSNTRFHNHNSFEYIDAGETKNKSYYGFLSEIPADFKGVDRIDVEGRKIVIEERSETDPRKYEINTNLINNDHEIL